MPGAFDILIRNHMANNVFLKRQNMLKRRKVYIQRVLLDRCANWKGTSRHEHEHDVEIHPTIHATFDDKLMSKNDATRMKP